jgi:hypothetical protein
MKHLKKFITESKSNTIDKEYVEMCFIDLIESDRFRQIQMFKFDTMMEVSFNVPMPEVKNFANAWFEDITPFTNCGAEIHQLYLDVEECVKKIQIQYPDYSIEYKQYTSGFNPQVFSIRITLKEENPF